jgi:DHA1 family bicyclomycin/chloramphenicol resistance-like MFS transporter
MALVMGLAPVLAPMIGGGIRLIGSWRIIFYALAGFGALVGIWIYLSLDESRSAATAALARSETVPRSFAALLRNHRLLGYLAAGSLNGAVLFTYVSSSSELVIHDYGFSPQLFSVVSPPTRSASSARRRSIDVCSGA